GIARAVVRTRLHGGAALLARSRCRPTRHRSARMTSAHVSVAARLHATTREVETPAELLDHLGAHGFAWFGDDVALVTAGVVARVDARDVTQYLAAIDPDGPVDGARGPLAVGALSWRGD